MSKIVSLGVSRYEAEPPPAPESGPDTGGGRPGVPGQGSSYINRMMYNVAPPAQRVEQQPTQPTQPLPPLTFPPDGMPTPTPDIPAVDTGAPQPPPISQPWPMPTDTAPSSNASSYTAWTAKINWKLVAMALGGLSALALLALLVSRRSR